MCQIVSLKGRSVFQEQETNPFTTESTEFTEKIIKRISVLSVGSVVKSFVNARN
jgi:hypothetical protein